MTLILGIFVCGSRDILSVHSTPLAISTTWRHNVSSVSRSSPNILITRGARIPEIISSTL